MSIVTSIKDDRNDNLVCVDDKGSICVTPIVPTIPPPGTPNFYQWYRSSLIGMNVDGSGTPQKFIIKAHVDYDIHITHMIIVVETPNINEEDFYENSGDLPVGWDLIAYEGDSVTPIIEKAKTLGDIQIQSAIVGKEKKINTAAGDERGMYLMELGDKIPGGLRLGRGSLDRIESVINDDLSVNEMIDFFIYFIGHKHVE